MMFIKQENEKMSLQIAEDELCRLDINKNNINKTYDMLMKSLGRVIRWEKPALSLVYETPKGKAGIMTIGEQIFTVRPMNDEPVFVPLNYSVYGVSQNADQEEILFIIAEEIIEDLENNMEDFAEVITNNSETMTKEYVITRLGEMLTDLENTLGEARKKYSVPEFIKNRLIMEEEYNQVLKTAVKAIQKLSGNK